MLSAQDRSHFDSCLAVRALWAKVGCLRHRDSRHRLPMDVAETLTYQHAAQRLEEQLAIACGGNGLSFVDRRDDPAEDMPAGAGVRLIGAAYGKDDDARTRLAKPGEYGTITMVRDFMPNHDLYRYEIRMDNGIVIEAMRHQFTPFG